MSFHGWYWLYAGINVEVTLLLDVWISPRRGTDPAVAFLGQSAEKHNLSEAMFLVDGIGIGYLAALTRCNLCSNLDYIERNLTEK